MCVQNKNINYNTTTTLTLTLPNLITGNNYFLRYTTSHLNIYITILFVWFVTQIQDRSGEETLKEEKDYTTQIFQHRRAS